MVSSSLLSVLFAISHQSSIYGFLSPSLHQPPSRYNNDFISSDDCFINNRLQSTYLAISTAQSTTQLTNNQEINKEKEPSYSAILKAIDYDHQREATESYPYLVSESVNSIIPNGGDSPFTADGKGGEKNVYQFPASPFLNQNTVSAIRNAAQSYFNSQREENEGMALGIDRVDLTDLINMGGSTSEMLLSDINKALETIIYPTVREGWYDHDAFTSSTQSTVNASQQSHGSGQQEQIDKSQPILTVTSASIFANGGYNGAKPSMTTFERDAGLFVVHVDLGNEDISPNLGVGGGGEADGREAMRGDKGRSEGSDEAMGGIFMESLIPTSTSATTTTTKSSNTQAIVGPIYPGQGIIHKSIERTAALVVPSNLHELDQQQQDGMGGEESEGLDCISRNEIIKSAERDRHYALRLVLTTKHDTSSQQEDAQTNDKDTPQYEAPAEERSYRLRNYAKFREDRVKYVTLAGLIDVTSHENYLWLGFDYLGRMSNDNESTEGGDGSNKGVDLHEQLNYVNKAIYNLEKATRLCDKDARVYFQLATALKAKMNVEQRLLEQSEGNEDNGNSGILDESVYLIQISKALELSAHLESAAVKAGVNGIQDLTICLNALADTSARMGQYNKALSVIDKWAECGSIRSSLAAEDRSVLQGSEYDQPSYEYISSADDKKVAVRTVGDVPVFSAEDIAMLTDAANRHFARAAGVQTSRYTMQYEGNSEVHLDDLCAADPILKTRIDTILNEKIYPLVRATIGQESDNHVPPQGSLCVYDSILVRYNGEKARAAGRVGASQPLHQDGGIYSVNIALNAHQDQDVHGFTGGGTFFEALTVGDDDYVQRPSAPGHAIVHKTTQRHAGAPTTSGIRDILVIFLTARRPKEVSVDENTWGIESAMRLQSVAKEMKRDKLLPFLRLARDIDPTNSDILYWLGVHLMQGDSNDPSDERWNEICQGVESLQYSAVLNPADARVHYHLGMAISTRHKYAMRTRRAHLLPPPKEAAETLIEAIETAMRLEAKCEKAGCKNDINIAAGYLCLGDFMARLRDPDKAIVYLNQVKEHIDMEQDGDTNWVHSMLDEVNSMLEYCKNESMKKKEASLVTK